MKIIISPIQEGENSPSTHNQTPLLQSWIAVIAVAGAVLATPAARAQTYINNHDQVPLWNQHHDFRTPGGGVTYSYNGIASAIPAAGGNNATGPFITYDQLAADGRSRFGVVISGVTNTPLYATSGVLNLFANTDYYDPAHNGADIAGGSQHCAPTSTGMWMEWLRQNSLPALANRGGEVPSIDAFGFAADTNQRQTPPGNGIGSIGTSRPNMIAAANSYVVTNYASSWFPPKIAAWNYSQNAYTRMINRSKPPVVFYENLDAAGNPTGYGHVVVGVGYDNLNAIVRDPWDATEKSKLFTGIQQLNDGLPDGWYDGVNPPSGDFNADWTRTRLEVMDLTGNGTAPSSYEPSPSNRAAHQSGDREWLGSDPQTPDGVSFVNFDTVNGTGTVQITISSISGMSLDAAFETDQPPILYLEGWIDWNKDFTWAPAEQIVQWSGAADFNGTQVLTFNFAIPPGFTGTTWARFRLSRGSAAGPLGFERFGEVEDYAIPPSTAAAVPILPAPGRVVLLLALLVCGILFVARANGLERVMKRPVLW